MEPNSANQLDWIINSAKHVVLFYDQTQTVKSSDLSMVSIRNFGNISTKFIKYKLKTQMRCEGGDAYLQYIKDVMSCLRKNVKKIENYDLFLIMGHLVESIRKKDDEMGFVKLLQVFSGNGKLNLTISLKMIWNITIH